jgi:NAD(P)-dependent dehydrogenase (short-subunit alcohol dehydrogenase family)
MHMDAVAARRTVAGAPVVHGVHLLMWLLDCIAREQPSTQPISSLKATFSKMVYVDERVEALIVQSTDQALRAQVLVGGVEALALAAVYGAWPAETAIPVLMTDRTGTRTDVPLDPPLAEVSGVSGHVPWLGDDAAMAKSFPDAARWVGAQRLTAFGCMTYLVGMVVPGLHSIFGALTLEATSQAAPGLEFAVKSLDLRFRRLQIEIVGGGWAGTLKAFHRLPPVTQPSMGEVTTQVARDEFRGAEALIIGGSRGLGEITAKLIAAGGGSVTITYATGRADAEALARHIADHGGSCGLLPYDVRANAKSQLAALERAPTHVYYFATPTISRRRSKLFANARFREFNAFYVEGFADLVEAAVALWPMGLTIFYPSTIFVDDRPADLVEYAMSKAAGEVLCAEFNARGGGVRVVPRRLGRLATDQTASLIEAEAAATLAVMLPIVRELHRV